MTGDVHPTAIIDPSASIGAGVRIGAYSVIGAEVVLGEGTVIGPHCSIQGPSRIGRNNRFHGHAAIGGEPQDKKFKGERVELAIGDDNLFREFVTVNRGTGDGGGITRIGSNNWFLAYSHVAHDCRIGDHCVFSNNATLAGHVDIGDYVIMSGFAGIHQFCRIGAHAFIGMGALVNGDVPPFLMVAQDGYAKPRGINAEGLKRRGFSSEAIRAIRRGYRALYVSGQPLAQAREELATIAQNSPEVTTMLAFLDHVDRPLLR